MMKRNILAVIVPALLVAGTANAAEIYKLKSMFRMPMIIAFLTVILGMAILMGYLTQFLF